MTFKIEKNIPKPAPTRGSKYPFDKMVVGDSFLVPAKNIIGTRAAGRYYQIKHPNTKFSILRDGDNYRCWKTK